MQLVIKYENENYILDIHIHVCAYSYILKNKMFRQKLLVVFDIKEIKRPKLYKN